MIASATTTQPQEASTQKFSRYRSVRQANASQQITFTAPRREASVSPPQNASIARSRSRYHRKSQPSPASPVSPPPLPQQSPSEQARAIHSHPASLAALTGEPYPKLREETGNSSQPRERTISGSSTKNDSNLGLSQATLAKAFPRSSARRKESGSGSSNSWEAIGAARAQEPSISRHNPQKEARDILAAEDMRRRRMKTQHNAAREAETSRKGELEGEEKKRQDLIEREQCRKPVADHDRQDHSRKLYKERVQATHGTGAKENPVAGIASENEIESNRAKAEEEQANARAADIASRAAVENTPSRPRQQSIRQRLGSLTRTSPTQEPTAFFALPRSIAMGPPIQHKATLPKDQVLPPALDAPISAVNAGERSVLVSCRESTITLPLTPNTTAEDMLESASTSMAECFDPQKSVLKESFNQLGLERPLRKYEHIRDVLNSWENDKQNMLFIITKDIESANDLDYTNVPKDQPGDTTVYMYHSQRPGKWYKRWITLRTDGQVFLSKKQSFVASEATTICHISDFDIYVPTYQQITKKIKPPKKLCYAVKSQQKSNMFLNGQNFVHFFATNDTSTAAEWYKAIHSWRSWYLVNILGEGQRQTTSEPPRPSTSRSGRGADVGVYTIGPVQSTPNAKIDQIKHYDMPAKDLMPARTASLHARRISDRTRNAPPSSFPTNLLLQNDDNHTVASKPLQSAPTAKHASPVEPDCPIPSTMLGRSNSNSQKSQNVDKQRNNSLPSSATTPPSITSMARSKSFKGTPSISTRRTQKPKPQPLIDLTPQYQEPPQHTRKGRGVAPEPGKQLVDLATELEQQPGAILVPPARAWRRPPTTVPSTNSESPDRSTTREKEPPRLDLARTATAKRDEEAFTGHGLLAGSASKRAQGANGSGAGVRTGDRTLKAKPLVDLQLNSQFQDGSLLRQVEASEGVD